MAKVVGVFNMSHTPFCYMPYQNWNQVRARRKHREDVPMDSEEENARKSERIQKGFATLRGKLAEARPDVIVIFGDDQLECFDFTNFPSFAVYVGEEFAGNLSTPSSLAQDVGGVQSRDSLEAVYAAARDGVGRATIKAHPGIAVGMLTGLMKRGFDPAFSMDMPKPEHGLGHAFMRPAESLTDLKTPIVPVLFNSYYAPQPTAMRCYQFGKAVGEAIEEHPSDLRVAVIGSGGLWHTPGMQSAYLDEDFDHELLGYLEAGDGKAMAECFDAYKIPEGDASQEWRKAGPEVTGMPGFGGPQGGTRETCHWIAAAGVADGSRSTIVDYIPVYASPIGIGFTYSLMS